MKRKLKPLLTLVTGMAVLLSENDQASGQTLPGLPEPGLVMYGTVTNANGAMPVLQGSIQWTVSGGGSTAIANGVLANVNGKYFYIVRVPFETRSIPGITITPTPNTLPLTDPATEFSRTATVLGTNATIQAPSPSLFTFGKADRGKVEKVNLLVDLIVDPGLDSDGDGVPDWAELIAGTDPNDPNSVLKLSSDIQPAAGGGLVIKWDSVPGKHYLVLRSFDVGVPFSPLSGDIVATSDQTQYTDSSATGSGPYFYLIQVIQ